MSLMIRCDNLRAAKAKARTVVAHGSDIAGETIKAYVLRRDGHTTCVEWRGSRICHRLIAGHITRGMWVDPSDLPCVIY